jgi:murein DD-endopeptidase MepM/ murein hydrolase activator NlpD
VASGTQLGRVGATGEATGSHLHFEVRVRGAAVDPLPSLH